MLPWDFVSPAQQSLKSEWAWEKNQLHKDTCTFNVVISEPIFKKKLYFKECKDTKHIYLRGKPCIQEGSTLSGHSINLSRVDCQENGHSVKICGAQSTCSHLSLGCVGGKDVQKYRYLLLLYRNRQWVAISITFNKILFDMLWAGNFLTINLKSVLCGTSYSVRFLCMPVSAAFYSL